MPPLTKEYQYLQELISHPGWEVFKELILNTLEKQINNNLKASARAGEAIESAKFAGQLDILPIIFKKPEDVLNEVMSK